jgi:hypothetical protein
MSDAYPGDVLKAAERIASEAIRKSFEDPLMPMVVHLKPAIAVAIMAERERITPDYIAAIIRRVDGNNALGAGALGEAIAAAIRKGDAS